MRLLPQKPILLHLLFAGCWFHQMGRVVHDNRLKDDDVFPFIPEPAWSLSRWRHRCSDAYKIGAWMSFKPSASVMSFLSIMCLLMFFLCFNTRDGTWHYYINIVFVITRKGSQYFCRSLAWVQARWGCWMFTCCVWRFLWFYLYIFDFFFFYPIREKSDCNDMMNVLEPGFFLVILLSQQILRTYWGLLVVWMILLLLFSFWRDPHFCIEKRVCWGVSVFQTGTLKALRERRLYLSTQWC